MEAYRKAWAAYATQDYRRARLGIQEALRTDPTNPHAHSLAGDLAYLAHDLDGARTAWARALTLEPRLRDLKERLDQLAREEALEAGAVARTTDLFLLRLPADDSIDAAWVLQELKAARTFLESQLQMRLQGPISVLIYTPQEFYGELHAPTEVAGLFDGKVRLPLRAQNRQSSIVIRQSSLREVLWHELAHAAVHQMAQARAPRWLHEGVAQVVQAEVGTLPNEALSIAARRGEAPSIAWLEGRGGMMAQGQPMEADLFYQTAWSHVEYLREHRGWVGVRRVLLAVGSGTSVTEALAEVSGHDEATWDRLWRRWLRQGVAAPLP